MQSPQEIIILVFNKFFKLLIIVWILGLYGQNWVRPKTLRDKEKNPTGPLFQNNPDCA